MERIFVFMKNTRPHLIIGDIHGDWAWYLLTKKYANRHNYQAVYVGDYVDSFVNDLSDDICVLNLISEDLYNSKNRGIYIRGNHDWGHINYDRHGCRGQTKNKRNKLRPKLLGMFNEMKDYYILGKLLITHAGLSYTLSDILSTFNKPTQYKEFLDSYLNEKQINIEQHLHITPASRNTSYYNPLFSNKGITWGRPISIQDTPKTFVPIDNLYQVFGHTTMGAIYEVAPNNFCIDTNQGDKSVLLYYPQKESSEYNQNERFEIITIRDLKRR